MRYFKLIWNETTGNELTDSWGESIFYYETNLEMNVLRQVEKFKNGKFLKYDTVYFEDKFGGLVEVPLDLEELDIDEINKEEFTQIWDNLDYDKFPEIVITEDTLWGQPRLEGRRLAVGDIISLIDVNESLHIVLQNYELSMQQARQALLYCKWKKCVDDQPPKFCHNCTLRVKRENSTLEEENDNWLIASDLLQKYF